MEETWQSEIIFQHIVCPFNKTPATEREMAAGEPLFQSARLQTRSGSGTPSFEFQPTFLSWLPNKPAGATDGHNTVLH